MISMETLFFFKAVLFFGFFVEKINVFHTAVAIAAVVIFIAVKATEGQFFVLLAIIKEVAACNTAYGSESHKCACESFLLTKKYKEHEYCADSLNKKRNTHIKFCFLKHDTDPLSKLFIIDNNG